MGVGEGSTFRLVQTGRLASVVRFVGEGGQGAVYEVAAGGERYALKWYHPVMATPSQHQAIATLVEWGPPSDRFLWPLEMAELSGRDSFGYVMPLRPARFRQLRDLLHNRVPVSWTVRTTVCMELAHHFFLLHSFGLCYRDISIANIFFDPADGAVLICDNDNVAVNDGSPSVVRGTPLFMAPEVVRGEGQPSTATDLYSLAVLLFYVLMAGHPLIGRNVPDWTLQERHPQAFGFDPRFVFDPDDESNRPERGEHDAVLDSWNEHPRFVRRLFERAFTEGLREPANRVKESVWRQAMARLRDAITICPWCGEQSLFDEDRPERSCPSCKRALGKPVRLLINGTGIVLNRDTVVFRHHLERDYDFSTTVADVVRHPQRADLWGLRNLAKRDWTVTPLAGTSRIVGPGQSIALVPETTIDFGPAQGRLVL